MTTPKKVGGTKNMASPPLQKVGGTCPPVHPLIYAHAIINPEVKNTTSRDKLK